MLSISVTDQLATAHKRKKSCLKKKWIAQSVHSIRREMHGIYLQITHSKHLVLHAHSVLLHVATSNPGQHMPSSRLGCMNSLQTMQNQNRRVQELKEINSMTGKTCFDMEFNHLICLAGSNP